MRAVIFQLILVSCLIAFCYRANAQVCTGSLGDPVINQTFGAGPNPGVQLPVGFTTMKYNATSCPNDGEYTIINSLNDSTNCHPYTWFNVLTDHTGNKNGYMMLVNASYDPSIFFNQAATGLCPNTTYEFSSYILNLIIPGILTARYTEPNIVFTITTRSGKILATDSTGTILPRSKPTWLQYGTYFTTPANVSDVIVTMTNKAPGGNGNDLVLDDITFRACGPIINTGFASIGGPAAQQLCQGTPAHFVVEASVVGNNSPTYQWQSSSTTQPWTDMPGKTTDTLHIDFGKDAAPNIYQYRLGVANGSNISSVQCRVYSSPLTVNLTPLPLVPPIAPQMVCQGNTLTLNASGGARYVWSGPGIESSSQNPLIINSVTAANAGTYSVTAFSDSGCAASPVQAIVKIIPKVVAAVGSNVTICAGETAELTASGGLYYKWTPSAGLDHDDIPNPVASPLQTTKYTVDVSNGGCDDSTKSITVTVNQIPAAYGGGNKIINEGQAVKLNGTKKGDNITGVFWTPATGLDNPTSLTPIASPTDNITYTLNVVSQTCGIATDSVYVRVYKKVIIPNAFSPNNDGINDLWDIKNLTTYPQSTIAIFNRFGQQLFQSTGYGRLWDGKYHGAPLPQGTYYYIIDLKDGQPKMSGWVMIAR